MLVLSPVSLPREPVPLVPLSERSAVMFLVREKRTLIHSHEVFNHTLKVKLSSLCKYSCIPDMLDMVTQIAERDKADELLPTYPVNDAILPALVAI
jgi:hypothetical protein